jgi:hypothetical protein
MKKVFSIILTVFLVIHLIAPVFAANVNAKTGYITVEEYDYSAEKTTIKRADIIEVTNVVSEVMKPIEHPVKNDNQFFKYFLVDGSTVLTALEDTHIFYVEKLEYKEGKYVSVKRYEQDKEHLVTEETGYSYYTKGSYIRIDEPGEYAVYVIFCGSEDKDYCAYIKVAPKGTAKPIEPKVKTAKFSNAKIRTNDSQNDLLVEAYNIDGYNYFKLRDIAYILKYTFTSDKKFTPKRFNVIWDPEKKAINLISDADYQIVGGECHVWHYPRTVKAVECTSEIYKDGRLVQLDAYTIEGYNYFKIRDIAKLFNFAVTWNAESKTIEIDVNKDYEE